MSNHRQFNQWNFTYNANINQSVIEFGFGGNAGVVAKLV